MKTRIIAVAVLLGLSSSAFAELKCSDPLAQIQLVVGRYEGGAPPRPDQRRHWSDLIYAGEKHEDVTYTFAEKMAISFRRDNMYSMEIFAALVTITMKKGKVLSDLSDYVICREDVYTGSPRR